MHPLYIAIDLGAGSGRVFIPGPIRNNFCCRRFADFITHPFESDGHLRWDFSKLFGEIKEGLRDAAARARELQRPVLGIGVDSWGVDYGLIDAAGELIKSPICYRDSRTRDVMQQAFTRVSREDISTHRHSVPAIQYAVSVGGACTRGFHRRRKLNY